MSAQHNNNTEPNTSGSLHINNLSSDTQSNFRAPAYSVFMQEYGQGVRYDQVVKIHLNTRLGRYPIIHRIYLIQPRSFVEQNKPSNLRNLPKRCLNHVQSHEITFSYKEFWPPIRSMQSKQTRGVRYNPVVKMHSCSSSNPSVQRCFTYQNVATKMKNVLHKTLLFTLYTICLYGSWLYLFRLSLNYKKRNVIFLTVRL